MPADLIAAVMAPKVALALAAADLHGAEDIVASDTASHSIATSFHHFVHLPMPESGLLKMLIGPEISSINWLGDKVGGIWHQMFDVPVSPDQARMVEYYAAGCPHCQHLEPVWKQAAAHWAHDSEASKVVWQQKQCLDEDWKPGSDYKECQEQQIMGFPTVKFFPAGSKTGDSFFFERTPEKLEEFAKTGIHPNPTHVPAGEGEMTDLKMVDYYSAACPHCKTLDPVWKDAEKKWDTNFAMKEDAPFVSFEKKECYDDHWKAGKDFMECKQLGIESFPNIKLLTPADDGHGFIVQSDYSGARTTEGIVDFLKHHSDMEEPQALDQAAQHDNANAIQEAASLQGSADLSKEHQPEPSVQEPGLAGAVLGKATIKVAPDTEAEVEITSNADGDAETGALADFPEAIKTAMAPLPLASLSCLTFRRSSAIAQKRPERSPAIRAPATPAQFL